MLLPHILWLTNCQIRYLFCINDNLLIISQTHNVTTMLDWNNRAKRLLKSELIKRGVSNSDLAFLLKQIGIEETKASIDSKISRGTFSASFFIQCLSVIGCNKLEFEEFENTFLTAAEPSSLYKKLRHEER